MLNRVSSGGIIIDQTAARTLAAARISAPALRYPCSPRVGIAVRPVNDGMT
jgi:hypothetical protein